MTLPTQLVLQTLLEDPKQEMYGLEICVAAGLPSGTIHPILARLESVGWLTSRWEQIDPATEGRPRRRYYRLNPNSVAGVRAVLARVDATAASRLARFRPGTSEASG
jgi:PadR family transcriptional regulator PadR